MGLSSTGQMMAYVIDSIKYFSGKGLPGTGKPMAGEGWLPDCFAPAGLCDWRRLPLSMTDVARRCPRLWVRQPVRQRFGDITISLCFSSDWSLSDFSVTGLNRDRPHDSGGHDS